MRGTQPLHATHTMCVSHWVSRGHVKPRCPRAHDRPLACTCVLEKASANAGSQAEVSTNTVVPGHTAMIFGLRRAWSFPALCFQNFALRFRRASKCFSRASYAIPALPLTLNVPSKVASKRLHSRTRCWRCSSLVCPSVRSRALWCAARLQQQAALDPAQPSPKQSADEVVVKPGCGGLRPCVFWRSA